MLPAVDPPSQAQDSATIVGVVFAAGMSSRYGKMNKLLVSVNQNGKIKRQKNQFNDDINDSVIRCSTRTLLNSNLSQVFVVVGHQSDRIRRNLSDLDVNFIENTAYASGHSSSVHAAVEVLNSRKNEPIDAAVFALGDMPYVDPKSVDTLIRAYQNGIGSALAAGYKGQRGNPVLFDQQYFSDLLDCNGDNGGKEVLLSASDGAIVETGDPGTLEDINQPSDLS